MFGPDYLKTGNATIPVYINNVHSNITLGLVYNVTKTWSGGSGKTLIATSNVITFANPNEPNQVREF